MHPDKKIRRQRTDSRPDFRDMWEEEKRRPGTPFVPEVDDRETDEGSSSGSGDHALELYLKQMGSIPMLTRPQEIALAKHLEKSRLRYRRAVLCSWQVLGNVVDTFEQLADSSTPLDRNVDLVPGKGLTVEAIQARLPGHLRQLRALVEEARAEYPRLLRLRGVSARERGLREWRQRLRQAVRLVEELSPRTELLDAWAEDIPADLLASPEEIAALLQVIEKRRAVYLRARRDLAEANLRLVVSIAKRYQGKGLSLPDLIQEGNSSLMRAVDKYDYRLGFKFGTYATWWIRQGMTRALSDLSRTIRIPSHQVTVLSALWRAHGELAAREGREPSLQSVADAVGVEVKDARLLGAAGRAPASLQEQVGDQDQTLGDFLQSEDSDNPTLHVDRNLLQQRVAEVLRCLPGRDRDVLELRFGLRDGTPRSLDEIAQMFGLTRERIRQIESRGLERLRQPEQRSRLIPFTDLS